MEPAADVVIVGAGIVGLAASRLVEDHGGPAVVIASTSWRMMS